MVEFTEQTVLPVMCEEAFDMSLSIDAHVDSFRESGERAVGGVRSGIIGVGEFVTWRARHFGITWTMTSVITEWDRPNWFVDEQRRGPFKSFRHEHRFVADGDSTVAHDRVVFSAPLGLLGRLAETAVLARYLRRLIRIRNEFLVESAGAHRE